MPRVMARIEKVLCVSAVVLSVATAGSQTRPDFSGPLDGGS